MCIPSCSIFHSDQIKYHHNSTLVTVKVGFLVDMAELLVGFLVGSVLKADMDEVMNKIRIWVVISGFGSQVMILGNLCVTGT